MCTESASTFVVVTQRELAKVAAATTLSIEQTRVLAHTAQSFGIGVEQFAQATHDLMMRMGVGFRGALRHVMTAIDKLNMVETFKINAVAIERVRFLPPEVRAIVRLGQQVQFYVRFDGTRCTVRKGRVFMPITLNTYDYDSVGVTLGDGRWTTSQQNRWHALGFATVLMRADRSYDLTCE